MGIRFKTQVFIFFLLLFQFVSHADEPKNSPEGIWKVMENGQMRSLVHLWIEKGILNGRILKIFYKKGEVPSDICIRCGGGRLNQPIKGLHFLWGATTNDGIQWKKNCSFLDPRTGIVYSCKLHLKDNGQRLLVNVYWWFQMLGSEHIWLRVT